MRFGVVLIVARRRNTKPYPTLIMMISIEKAASNWPSYCFRPPLVYMALTLAGMPELKFVVEQLNAFCDGHM